MQRPTGITILAILAIIAGIFGLLAGLADFGLGSLRVLGGSATLRPGVAGIGLVTIVGAFFVLIGAVLSLAFGIGALNLSGWAWTWCGGGDFAPGRLRPASRAWSYPHCLVDRHHVCGRHLVLSVPAACACRVWQNLVVCQG